jgi:hypothetical protein
MAQFDETQMNVCGVKNNMVNYRGELFSIHMPLINMQRFIKNDCSNCKKYARWQGCIIGLCTNCEMDYTGCGFKDIGLECNSNFKQSANNTYLKGVNWNEIGDTDLDCNSINIEKDVDYVIHPTKEEVYFKDTRKLPYTYTFYSKRDEFTDEFNRNETPEDRLQKIQEYCDEAYERFQEKDEEVAVTEEQLTAEIKIKKQLELMDYNASMLSFRESYDSEEEEEKEEEEDQEEEEMIEVFLTENGKEEKWFEMKVQEYDEEHNCEEPLNLIVNEQESVFHKINDRFFTQTNQFMPAFQDTESTFYERFQHSCYQSAIQYATEFAAEDIDDEISTSSNSSSTTTYTELPELQENDGNMYFNIIEDYESDEDEELQKLKRPRIYPSVDEMMNLADLVEDVEEEEDEESDCKRNCEEEDEESNCLQRNCEEEEETQEEYELRTQTGIFDWPKPRLNEDECSYYGICYEKTISDPY